MFWRQVPDFFCSEDLASFPAGNSDFVEVKWLNITLREWQWPSSQAGVCKLEKQCCNILCIIDTKPTIIGS